MQLALVAAMDKTRVIGVKNQLPWQMPADLAHFKQLTLNKPVVMGRKTFDSIGRPLPQRRNVIITRQQNYQQAGCEVVHSLDEAMQLLQDNEEVMLIGGGELFAQALPHANTLYLTIIDTCVEGDTFFPHWNENEWQQITSTLRHKDEKNPFDCRFITLQRISF